MKTILKQLSFASLFLIFTVSATAQTSYWADGEKVNLFETKEAIIVHMATNQPLPNDLESTLDKEWIETVEIHTLKNRFIVTLEKNAPYDIATILPSLGMENTAIRSITTGFQLDDGFHLYPTHEIVLKLKPGQKVNEILSQLNLTDVSFNRTSYDVVILETENIENVVSIANKIEESGLVEWCHPDWYAKAELYNDPLYPQQFQMHNTGQTIDGFTGQNDVDCDAPEAWAITKGSSAVKVAIIDDGVESHEDFNDAAGNSRLISGFSPINNGNGTPIASGAHGVACAGIVTASHNNIGVMGVAPNVRMHSVNIFVGGESTQNIADGITWAKNQGVAVMSNSWGWPSCTFSATNVTNAINDAYNNGNGGKGCTVVFASGNNFFTCVGYPARLANCIAVGAVTNTGVHSSYANQGPTLDVVAPSNGAATVRTTDRMGSPGYSSGNTTNTFGGTSAACPVVAGVACLVTSYNSSLTSAQVKSILESSATDMGASGFDNTFGHGRVSAYDALIAAGGGGGGVTCNTTISGYPYNESFESGSGSWVQVSGDDFDWTRRSGGTPSSNTGPTAAANGSFYMYTEASSPNYPSKTSIFMSPCFNLNGLSNPTFNFKYHMYGSTAMGSLSLQVSTDDGNNWSGSIWSRSSNQGNAWLDGSVSLAAYSGVIRLRFVGVTGSTWQGDMAIDQLNLQGATGGGSCTATATVPYYAGFESGFDNWTQVSGDDFNWSRNSGGTPSSNTGPTSASAGSYYLYCEVSSPNYPSKSAAITTPCISIPNGGATLTFDYHMYGGSVGTMNMWVTNNNGASYTQIWTQSGNQGNQWNAVSLDLGAFAGDDVFFYIQGTSGTSWNGDMAIDDFSITTGSGGGGCTGIDFSNTTVSAYGGSQDQGTHSANGISLIIRDNAWKSIPFNYTVTANTVLEFQFYSFTEGEIHGIGFDNDNVISSNRTFKVFGTQNWGITNYDDFVTGTNVYKRYTIPVGNFYTGTFDRMFFVADKDAAPQTNDSYYYDVRVYEVSCNGVNANMADMGSFEKAQIGYDGEIQAKLFPNPFNEGFTIDFNLPIDSDDVTVIEIYDEAGRTAIRQVLSKGVDRVTLGEDLAAGFYFVKISNGPHNVVKKAVKIDR